MEAKKRITIRLDESVIKKLKQYSDEYGIPYGKIIDQGIRMRLKQIKDNSTTKHIHIRNEEI